MKKLFVYTMLCSFSLLFMAMSCEVPGVESEDWWIDIPFENQSGDDIYYMWNSGKSSQNPLPSSPDIYDEKDDWIMCMEDGGFRLFGTPYEGDKYLYIIIWKPETIEKYTRRELAEQQIYDTLFTYSYADLEKMNFKIIYTGDSIKEGQHERIIRITD